MKTTLIWVLLVAVIFCEGRRSLKDRFRSRIRRRPKPAPTTKFTPTIIPTTQAEVLPVGINSVYNIPELRKINSTKAFYDYFKKIPRNGSLPDGRLPGKHSTAVNTDGSVWNCEVRPTLVSLPAPHFGLQIFPPCVLLNRCTGCCFARNLLTCKPLKKKMTPVQHFNIFMPSGKPQDITYTLVTTMMEEHVDCGCECIKTADSCDKKKQVWNSNTCSCDCRPAYQESEVDCQKPYKYVKEKCGCVCNKAEQECSNPLHKWSIEECKCVCRNEPKCIGRQRLDEANCQCTSQLSGR
nr:balbiani ring protein 3-like [Pocillopora verrucosa]